MVDLRRASASILVLGLLLLGCTDDDSAAEFCRLLREPPADSRWIDVDLVIYVDPAADSRVVDELRGTVERNSAVVAHDWASQQEAYDEFVELYADSPEMIDAVRPETLPPVIRVTLIDGVDDATALGFDDQPGVYQVVYGRQDPMTVIDWSIRPLTTEFGTALSAFTIGRTGIDLAGKAPPEIREHAQATEMLWAQPFTATDEVRAQAMQGARQIAAYYDTECG